MDRRVPTAGPDDPALDAMRRMDDDCAEGRVLVMDDGVLIGLLWPSDVGHGFGAQIFQGSGEAFQPKRDRGVGQMRAIGSAAGNPLPATSPTATAQRGQLLSGEGPGGSTGM